MKKRLWSLIMVVALCIAAMPTPVFAADPVAEYDGVGYETLNDALTHADSGGGGTVDILATCDLPTAFTMSNAVTFNLNDHEVTLTSLVAASITVNGPGSLTGELQCEDTGNLEVDSGATVTLNAGSNITAGNIVLSSGAVLDIAGDTDFGSGNISITGSTLKISGGDSTWSGASLTLEDHSVLNVDELSYCSLDLGTGSLTVNASEVNIGSEAAWTGNTLTLSNGSELSVTGRFDFGPATGSLNLNIDATSSMKFNNDTVYYNDSNGDAILGPMAAYYPGGYQIAPDDAEQSVYFWDIDGYAAPAPVVLAVYPTYEITLVAHSDNITNAVADGKYPEVAPLDEYKPGDTAYIKVEVSSIPAYSDLSVTTVPELTVSTEAINEIYSFVMPASDVTVDVSFVPQKFPLTLNANGGTIDGVASKTIQVEYDATLDTVLAGYIPERGSDTYVWTEGGGEYPATMPAGALELTAKWSRPATTITGIDTVYDGTEHTITIDPIVTGDVVTYQVGSDTPTTVAPSFKDVIGTEVKVTIENPNYDAPYNTIEQTVDVNIAQAPLTITANDATKEYGAADPVFTATVTGAVGGETINPPVVREEGENVGSYTIAAVDSGLDNYDVNNVSGQFTITKKALSITTSSADKEYDGTALTSPDSEISGLTESDGLVVTVTVTGSQTNAGESENAYSIDWGTVNSANYELTETLGTLTVNKRQLTVTTGSGSKDYDGTPITNTEITVEGLTDADAAVVTYGTTGSQTDVGYSNNTYVINWGTASASNYEITETLGRLEIFDPAAVYYEVSWLVDGEVIATNQVIENGYAEYAGSNPEKATDETGHYSFAGWDEDPATYPITNDTVFNAVFNTEPHTWEDGVWEHDDDGHWQNCTKGCDIKGNQAAHTFETVTTPATYDSDGLRVSTCTVCGYKVEKVLPMLVDDDDDDYTPPASDPDEEDNKSVTLVDANGRSITLDTSDAEPNAADPTQQDYSYFGRSEDPASLNNQVYEKLDVITDIVAGEALGLQDTDLMGAVFTLPTVNASEQDDYDVTNVQEADYVAPDCRADGNAVSIIEAGTTAGSEFYNVNPATADKTIKYAELKPGDVVRTTAFNGIYVTSLDKKAANYEAEAKTLKSNIFASFVAFDMDHPEVFWLTGSTKVRVTSVTKGDKSTAYFFLVLADDKDFNMLQPDYKVAGSLEAGIKLRDDSAAKILASVTASIPANADRKTKVQALNKWLTLNNEYNRTPDLTTIGYRPHRSISALAGSTGTNGPVCDGYSRAFKLLCDRLGVPCMLQCGNAFVKAGAAPEYHMWNQIQMEDGNWYGVDICWNDPLVNGAPAPVSGKENESWLFAGRDTMIGGLKFADSHQVQAQSDGDGTYFSSLNIYLSGFDSSLITGFEDVGLGDWFYDYVRTLCDKGIMEGTSAATFRPYATSNRAQIAMTLYRLAGKPSAEIENVFADVNEADWFFDPVLWAKANEITDGVTATSFAPLQDITREQLVTLLYRYAGSIGKAGDADGSVLDRFSDKAEVSAYAVTPMAWAVENGIVDGKSSTRLAPQDTANRAELAAILCRFLDK